MKKDSEMDELSAKLRHKMLEDKAWKRIQTMYNLHGYPDARKHMEKTFVFQQMVLRIAFEDFCKECLKEVTKIFGPKR